jgi:GST-like protein
MIDEARDLTLLTAGTANGARPAIMLEELGVPYTCEFSDLGAREQRTSQFLNINPAGSIPVLSYTVGGARRLLAQSAAIVFHLAEMSGRLLPSAPSERAAALQWFAHAITDVGPASAAFHHESHGVPQPHAENAAFFRRRLARFLKQADARLSREPFLAGAEVTITDVCLFPTVAIRTGIAFGDGDCPSLRTWFERVSVRQGFLAGLKAVGL